MPLLWPDSDAVGDRRTQELFHRPGLEIITSQVAVLRVAFQQSLALQEAADAPCEGLSKPGQLGAGAGDEWTRIKTVVTPGGSDDAHDGTWITGQIARWLYGTYDPVYKVAYWYDPWVTDQQNVELNWV